jgi:hypothetical protein
MPLAIVLVLAWLYFTFKEVPAVKGVLHGASRGGRRAHVGDGDQDGAEVL